MTRKKHRQRKKRRTLAQQLGINSYFVMDTEEKRNFHRMLLSYELGVNSEYPDKLRQYLIETIPNNKNILKYHQRRRKGWHLQGKSLEGISRFLKDKLETAPQKRIDELVKDVNRNIKDWGVHHFNQNLVSIYEEVRDSDLPEDRKNKLLNGITDRAKNYNQPHPGDLANQSYFDFVTKGRNLPEIIYLGDDKPIYLGFGIIETDAASSLEFTRGIEGNIRSTAAGSATNLKDPDTQKHAQKFFAGSIANCGRHIADKRKEQQPCPFNTFRYYSKAQKIDTGYGREESSEFDPISVEQTDDEVMGILSEKYAGQTLGAHNHVFFNFHGRTKARKTLMLKPGFLNSFEGIHPREVAEQLCNDIEGAYSTVNNPAETPVGLENHLV